MKQLIVTGKMEIGWSPVQLAFGWSTFENIKRDTGHWVD